MRSRARKVIAAGLVVLGVIIMLLAPAQTLSGIALVAIGIAIEVIGITLERRSG